MPDALSLLATFLTGAAVALLPLYFRIRADREERKKERLVHIRRQVYLEAFEALGKSTVGLLGMLRTDIPPGGAFEGLQSNAGWNFKAYAVGEPKTVEALVSAGAYFQESILHISLGRLDLEDLSRRIREAERRRTQLAEYQGYLNSQMTPRRQLLLCTRCLGDSVTEGCIVASRECYPTDGRWVRSWGDASAWRHARSW